VAPGGVEVEEDVKGDETGGLGSTGVVEEVDVGSGVAGGWRRRTTDFGLGKSVPGKPNRGRRRRP